MNPATHRGECNADAPVQYTALELNSTTWKVVFGDGASTVGGLAVLRFMIRRSRVLAQAAQVGSEHALPEPRLI